MAPKALTGGGDEQPQEQPVDFDEWAKPKEPTMWRHLVAGFRHKVQQVGDLLVKRTPTEWDDQFEKFRAEPRG